MNESKALDRRTFLQGSGLTLAGVGLSSLLPTPFMSHALGAGAFDDKRLLFIFQRGGNDGLNTLIPQGDGEYNNTLRPTLHIPSTDSIDLGNNFAHFHPACADMVDLLNSNQLAAIHRVGYPGQSRSHFDSQRVWENGNPANTALFEGWLYRFVQEQMLTAGADIPVLTAQANAPLLIRGNEKFINVANPDSFDYLHDPPKRDKYQAAWRRVFDGQTGLQPFRPILANAGLNLIDTLDEYRAWDQENWHPTDPNSGNFLFPVSDETNPSDPGGPGGMMFPQSAYDFFKQLKVCALSLLESVGSANGTRVAGTELTGWDHHNQQGQLQGIQRDLLLQLSYGMKSLSIVLDGLANDEPRNYPSIWNDTVVVTLTEFGRTSAENGSTGTDHAEACVLFAAGGSVNGGIYNCDQSNWTSQGGAASPMFDVNGRYLSYETDYRAVMWEILRDHMGATPASVETIFPGYTATNPPELGLI